MSLVSGFPQPYHHHPHVHPGHHHHHHHPGNTLQSPPAEAVYVAAATTAYYPSPTRYATDTASSGIGPMDGGMVGGGSPYFAAASWGAAYGSTGGAGADSPTGELSPDATADFHHDYEAQLPPADYMLALGTPGSGGGGSGQFVSGVGGGPGGDPTVISGRPPVKRRVTANRKERRRTLSINSAFSDLRDCIPNVPSDTKLSKIKTLRLATSYIAYLMDILARDDPGSIPEGGFKADINKKMDSREDKKKREMANLLGSGGVASCPEPKKTKGRTGWPQHVWALELKQ